MKKLLYALLAFTSIPAMADVIGTANVNVAVINTTNDNLGVSWQGKVSILAPGKSRDFNVACCPAEQYEFEGGFPTFTSASKKVYATVTIPLKDFDEDFFFEFHEGDGLYINWDEAQQKYTAFLKDIRGRRTKLQVNQESL